MVPYAHCLVSLFAQAGASALRLIKQEGPEQVQGEKRERSPSPRGEDGVKRRQVTPSFRSLGQDMQSGVGTRSAYFPVARWL